MPVSIICLKFSSVLILMGSFAASQWFSGCVRYNAPTTIMLYILSRFDVSLKLSQTIDGSTVFMSWGLITHSDSD